MTSYRLKSVTRVLHSILVVALLLGGSGCDRGQEPAGSETNATTNGVIGADEQTQSDDSTQTPPPENGTTTARDDAADFEPRSGWTVVTEAELSEAETATLATMSDARQKLAQRLMGALSAHIAAHGPASAVEFCSNEAEPIAAAVMEETGVEVGRTSFKLRNQDNAARPWMTPIVEARYVSPVVMRGDDGQLAASHPIPVGAMCLRCHGESGALDAEVLAAIEEHYSSDEATGFAEGDLRGWFWTEATVASANP